MNSSKGTICGYVNCNPVCLPLSCADALLDPNAVAADSLYLFWHDKIAQSEFVNEWIQLFGHMFPPASQAANVLLQILRRQVDFARIQSADGCVET